MDAPAAPEAVPLDVQAQALRALLSLEQRLNQVILDQAYDVGTFEAVLREAARCRELVWLSGTADVVGQAVLVPSADGRRSYWISFPEASGVLEAQVFNHAAVCDSLPEWIELHGRDCYERLMRSTQYLLHEMPRVQRECRREAARRIERELLPQAGVSAEALLSTEGVSERSVAEFLKDWREGRAYPLAPASEAGSPRPGAAARYLTMLREYLACLCMPCACAEQKSLDAFTESLGRMVVEEKLPPVLASVFPKDAVERAGYLSPLFRLQEELGEGRVYSCDELVRLYREVAEGVDLPAGGDRWGKAICLFNFGLCCETGQGVALSDEEAFRLYRASANLGFPRAMTRLGLCYAQGKGVAASDEEAALWFRRASERGDAEAAYQLGLCCARGKGVPRSNEEALQCFREAASQGWKAALDEIARLSMEKGQ